MSLEKQLVESLGCPVGLQSSFLSFPLKSLSPGTPILPTSFFLTPSPCSVLVFHVLGMFGCREAASVLFSFFSHSFCSLSDPLSHFPSLDIASIYIHV